MVAQFGFDLADIVKKQGREHVVDLTVQESKDKNARLTVEFRYQLLDKKMIKQGSTASTVSNSMDWKSIISENDVRETQGSSYRGTTQVASSKEHATQSQAKVEAGKTELTMMRKEYESKIRQYEAEIKKLKLAPPPPMLRKKSSSNMLNSIVEELAAEKEELKAKNVQLVAENENMTRIHKVKMEEAKDRLKNMSKLRDEAHTLHEESKLALENQVRTATEAELARKEISPPDSNASFVEELQNTIEELNNIIDDQKTSLQENDKSIAVLKQENLGYRYQVNKIEQLNVKIEQIEIEKKQLETKNRVLLEKQQSSISAPEKLAFEEKIEALQTEVDAIRVSNQKLLKIQDKFDVIQKSNQTHKTQVEVLEQRLSDAFADKSQFDNDLASMRKLQLEFTQIRGSETHIDKSFQSELHVQNENLTKERSDLHRRISNLESEREYIKSAYNNLLHVGDQLLKKVEHYEQEYSQGSPRPSVLQCKQVLQDSTNALHLQPVHTIPEDDISIASSEVSSNYASSNYSDSDTDLT